jgi:hypothetical protein
MVLAGGMLPVVGCGTGVGVGIPCGNANPDPCICGRPSSSAQERAACDFKQACEKAGGIWEPGPTPTGACQTDAGIDGPAPVTPDGGNG